MNQLTPAREMVEANAAVEVEQQMIGYCLADADVARQVLALVEGSDFIEPLHREIFEIIRAGFKRGRDEPGRELVVAALGNQQVTDEVDLRDYLRRAANSVVLDARGKWRDVVAEFREMSARRNLASLGRSLVGSRDDVPAMLDRARAAVDKLTLRHRKGRTASYSAHDATRRAITAIGQPNTAITTGYTDLDAMLGGWARNELSVIAARPGMGKSALATGVATRAAKAGHATLMFSLEMHDIQIGSRMLTDLAHQRADPIYYESLIKHQVDPRHASRLEAAADMYRGLPLRIEEQRGLSIADIQARTRQAVADSERGGNRLALMLVDHIGLVRPSDRYSGNRTREVAEISDGLATLAKDLGIAVVALSQLNRGVEGRDNKRPSLSDLRDSGAIEEDASAVLFLYRPAYYLERSTDNPEQEMQRMAELEARRNTLDVIVAKNRNGRTGTTTLWIDIGANAIRNYLSR